MNLLKVQYTTFPVLLEVIPDRTQEHSQSSSADLLFSPSLILNNYLYFISGVTFSSLYYGVIFFKFPGVDYSTPNPSSLVFTAAWTIQCTNIPITDDMLIEGPVHETFNITLTQTHPTDPGVQLAPSTATVSIDDNDGK